MTVNLSQKDYAQLLMATSGHPDQVFQPETDIFMKGGIMAHKATCTIHAGMRCDCWSKFEDINKFVGSDTFLPILTTGIDAVT